MTIDRASSLRPFIANIIARVRQALRSCPRNCGTSSSTARSTSPLMPSDAGARVSVRNGKASVTDGPFIETREHIAGYFFIHADSLAAAVEVAKRIPGARLGYVEVRELREITGLPEKIK